MATNSSRSSIQTWLVQKMRTNTRPGSTSPVVLPLNLSPMLVFAPSRLSKCACRPPYLPSPGVLLVELARLPAQKAPQGKSTEPCLDHELSWLIFMRSLYKGLYPLWGRQIPYTMMKFASFETVVEMIYHRLPGQKSDYGKGAQTGVSFAGGYIAGILCAIVR